MRQSVQVTILGQRFNVTSEASAEQVQKVAAYANGRLEEIRRASKTADSQSLAVLALLNVTAEFFEIRGNDGEVDPLEARLRNLVERMDKALNQSP